jgi:hypothetical protein
VAVGAPEQQTPVKFVRQVRAPNRDSAAQRMRARIWFGAAIGVAFGYGWYVVGAVATLYSAFVPRIPHITRKKLPDEQ